MAIDGIGRKGPVVAPDPAAGAGGASGTASPTREFDPGRAERPAASSSVEGAAPTALERLRSGVITLAEYLELKVEQATAHLTMLPPAELESVRSALRDRLAADPSLGDLVRAATGSTPQPPRDE
jgi:hypothetical protein